MTNKTLIIVTFAVFALIILIFAPIPPPGTKGVHIVSNVQISQGQFENFTDMEIVKINGSLVNDGDITAEIFKLSVVFIDEAHDKVEIRTIYENVDLLPNGDAVLGFEAQYLRNKTIPKTSVNATLQLEWMENGVLKQM